MLIFFCMLARFRRHFRRLYSQNVVLYYYKGGHVYKGGGNTLKIFVFMSKT